MKKLIQKIVCSICTITLCLSMGTVSMQASNDIKVLLDGQEISFDVPPQIINDRTMVPMRAIFEALGYEVTWNENTQFITAYSSETDIMIGMQVGSNWLFVGTYTDFNNSGSSPDYVTNNAKTLDVPPQIIDGRTLVPVRAISESSNCDVQWNPQNKTVIISSKNTSSNKIKLGEGAPAQYGATHFITPEQVIEAVYNKYGVVVKHISTGNTAFEFEGNGIKFRVDRWYSTPEIDVNDLGLDIYFKNNNLISAQNKIFGWWLYCEDKNEAVMREHAINIQFKQDGTFYLQTWRTKGEGTFTIDSQGKILVEYDRYFNYAGTSEYVFDKRIQSTYKFDGTYLITTDEYGTENQYERTNNLITSGDIANNITDQYEDISANITQIRSFIDSGKYLEAIRECEQTKSWHTLSPTDINLLDSLKADAQNKYDAYIAEQKKWKEYYYDDWCIGFTGLASYKPTYFKSGDHIQVYNLGGNTIDITSYKIGIVGDSGKLTSNIKECVKLFETIVRYPADSFEILSETDTSAGDFEACQRTYRITEYTNRYKTKANYKIIRHIVFKYGEWIYLIDAEQNKYIWDDDFYDLLEKVRTSIKFY